MELRFTKETLKSQGNRRGGIKHLTEGSESYPGDCDPFPYGLTSIVVC